MRSRVLAAACVPPLKLVCHGDERHSRYRWLRTRTRVTAARPGRTRDDAATIARDASAAIAQLRSTAHTLGDVLPFDTEARVNRAPGVSPAQAKPNLVDGDLPVARVRRRCDTRGLTRSASLPDGIAVTENRRAFLLSGSRPAYQRRPQSRRLARVSAAVDRRDRVVGCRARSTDTLVGLGKSPRLDQAAPSQRRAGNGSGSPGYEPGLERDARR